MTLTSPKIIATKRKKIFTKIKNPYKSYLNADWRWSDIFNDIEAIKNDNDNFIKIISTKYGIIYGTLKNKYNAYCKNKLSNLNLNEENRGGSNKLLSIDDEKELYKLIINEYIEKDKPLTNNIIKVLAKKKLKEVYNDNNISVSIDWCTRFKKRWNMSSQRIKCSKIATKLPSDDEIKIFLDEYNKKSKNVKDKYIFNYDETSYNICNPPKTAIRIKGSDNVKIKCKNNLKENITVGFIISKGGSFDKPLIIAKGKTERCLKKYELTNEVVSTYTNTGWVNDDCIIMILNMISKKTKGEDSILLMDQYGSHMTDKVMKYANDKNVHIMFIPVGMTSKYQQLDVQSVQKNSLQ